MAKQSINLVNPFDVETYLEGFSNGNEKLARLLVIALASFIRKSPEYMETLQSLPENAPAWLTQKWNGETTYHRFEPRKNIRLAGQVHAASLWLEQALEYELEWLQNVDEQGRPKKLLKLSNFDRVMEERAADDRRILDKKRERARMDLKEETAGLDIAPIMTFDDGHVIVKLLTPRALDRESAFLEHCIGDGYYDSELYKDTYFYYSLRTQDNTPCATFSVDRDYKYVTYLAGRRNGFPEGKHMRHVATFCYEYYLDITACLRFSEGFTQPAQWDKDLYDLKPSEKAD